MESSAEIRIYLPEKGRYKVILEGKSLGGLIGRRGETLDAIQQLTSYAVNRSGGGRVRIQLDAEGYREKREQSLQHLARKVAAKVTKYRRSVTLEPMNAYERHVIHTALQDVPGVTTYSTGVGNPNRPGDRGLRPGQEMSIKGDRRSPFCDTARRGGLSGSEHTAAASGGEKRIWK